MRGVFITKAWLQVRAVFITKVWLQGVFITKAWLQSRECSHGYKGLAGEHASLLLLADDDASLKEEHLP